LKRTYLPGASSGKVAGNTSWMKPTWTKNDDYITTGSSRTPVSPRKVEGSGLPLTFVSGLIQKEISVTVLLNFNGKKKVR
jgi:hypothetical protein